MADKRTPIGQTVEVFFLMLEKVEGRIRGCGPQPFLLLRAWTIRDQYQHPHTPRTTDRQGFVHMEPALFIHRTLYLNSSQRAVHKLSCPLLSGPATIALHDGSLSPSRGLLDYLYLLVGEAVQFVDEAVYLAIGGGDLVSYNRPLAWHLPDRFCLTHSSFGVAGADKAEDRAFGL